MREYGEVWRAGSGDVAAAAVALARASVDEAVDSWVTPGQEARRRRA
ncbi:MAG TPA: hypothetical protein VE546_23700 [Streptomyces sp.]|nr:hypothetical protein [Streptomyces sp.]HZG06540.1 hypothetical protein [Streptomyces sp.]